MRQGNAEVPYRWGRYPFDIFLHRQWPVVTTILSCQKNYAVVATLSSFLDLLFSATPPGKISERQKLHGEEIRIHIRNNELYHNNFVAREDVTGSTFLSKDTGAMKVSTTATTVIIDPQDSVKKERSSTQNDWKVVDSIEFSSFFTTIFAADA